ncbi:hypothetical protein HK096_009422 [Nowakowskiella sp. JEL0078]|nr:hypothetical protein HK096_009422 [Nowakowskiella sp. JEL0078]
MWNLKTNADSINTINSFNTPSIRLPGNWFKRSSLSGTVTIRVISSVGSTLVVAPQGESVRWLLNEASFIFSSQFSHHKERDLINNSIQVFFQFKHKARNRQGDLISEILTLHDILPYLEVTRSSSNDSNRWSPQFELIALNWIDRNQIRVQVDTLFKQIDSSTIDQIEKTQTLEVQKSSDLISNEINLNSIPEKKSNIEKQHVFVSYCWDNVKGASLNP